jgi:hypothetical protein
MGVHQLRSSWAGLWRPADGLTWVWSFEVASKSEKRRAEQLRRDAAYRRALGIKPGEDLPGKLGQAASGGGGRGGRGAAQKGHGRNS